MLPGESYNIKLQWQYNDGVTTSNAYKDITDFKPVAGKTYKIGYDDNLKKFSFEENEDANL